MRSILKDVFSVGVSKVIIIAFGLATSIITARILGPEKNGIISALLVFPSIFLSFGSLGIRQSTTYLLGQGVHSEDKIKTAITQIWVLTSIVSLIACFLLIKFLSVSSNSNLYIFLAILPIPFVLFNTYNSGIFLGKNNIKEFNKINWIPTVVIFLLTVLFLVLFNLDIEGYLLALIAGPISISIVLLFKNKFINSFSFIFNWSIIKSLLGLGMIYALALLVINLNYKFDIIMLERMSNPYETGIYSKGANITEFLWQIPMLLSTIVFARSATAKNGKEFSLKVTQLLRVAFVFIGFGSLVLWLLSDVIILNLFGMAFFDSITVLNYLLPGVILLTVYKVLNMDLAGKGKPWISMYAMVPALVVNVVMNYYIIPIYGASGAALSSSISYTFAAILFIFVYAKTVKLSMREILIFSREDFKPISKLFKR